MGWVGDMPEGKSPGSAWEPLAGVMTASAFWEMSCTSASRLAGACRLGGRVAATFTTLGFGGAAPAPRELSGCGRPLLMLLYCVMPPPLYPIAGKGSAEALHWSCPLIS